MKKMKKAFEKIWSVMWIPSMIVAVLGGPLSDLVANEKTRNRLKTGLKAHLIIHNGCCFLESIMRFFK